ncbi:MAG TPA: FliM/FliN family flagellar motor switch protein [Candidatus Acidoferrales bacterium]|nr:FliM/FliN family flagellar motor switch protein [Candidatus Acidoferrales bacterium]
MTDNAHRETQLFFASLADAAKEVLSQLAGSAINLDLQGQAPADVVLQVPFTAEGALTGGFSFRFAGPDVKQAASVLMGEEADESTPLTEDQREAAIELSRQICGRLASALRSRFGSLELRNDTSLSEDWAEVEAQQITIRLGERTLSFQTAITDELSKSLQAIDAALARGRTPESGSDAPSSEDSIEPLSSDARSGRSFHEGNLDLLLELELPVTLRFGSRQMLLKEVMELTTGSVVELDRRVREPVDLLIDNRLIARGEVVLMEGNYGVRVLEVATERERIACLR